MGDRVTCTLNLAGTITAEKFAPLKAVLDEHKCSSDEYDNMTFYEVNYADIDNLDDRLEGLLRESGLTYAWNWEAGGGFGSGTQVFDPGTQVQHEYMTHEGELVLPLNLAKDPAAVAEAERVCALIAGQPLVVIENRADELQNEMELIAQAIEEVRHGAYGTGESVAKLDAAWSLIVGALENQSAQRSDGPQGHIEEAFWSAASTVHHEDGKCEIDDNATVSISEDGGAYVQAWVWVDNTDLIEEHNRKHMEARGWHQNTDGFITTGKTFEEIVGDVPEQEREAFDSWLECFLAYGNEPKLEQRP